MSYIISIPLLLFGILKLSKQKHINYLSLFCLMWGTIIFLSGLQLFGMLDFSIYIYVILLLGIIGFCFGYIWSYYSKKFYKLTIAKGHTSKKQSIKVYEFNMSILWIIEIVVTCFVVIAFLQTIVMLSMGMSMGTIHAMYLNRGDEAFFKSTLMREMHSKIIVPCLYALIPVSVLMLLSREKRYTKFVLVNIINVILWVIATGGRIIILYFVIDLILALPIFKLEIPSKFKKRMQKVVLLLLVFIISYTIFRKNLGEFGNVLNKFTEEIYDYISLCVPLSAHWIDEIQSDSIQTYGLMSFAGILSNINYLIVRLGGPGFTFLETANNISSSIEMMIPIFSNASCNAFVTAFFYYYVDFREFGVLFGSIFYGIICGYVNRSAIKKKDLWSVLLYLLIAQSVFKTFIRWEFYNSAYILAFIYLRILIKQKKATSSIA